MAQEPKRIEQDAPEAPRRPERPIDLVHLAKQCLGDEHLEYEILRLFDVTARTYLSRLELSATIDELTLNLHSLRGAAGGVGAWAIADLAKRAEDELRGGRPVNPERIGDIGMAVEEARGFIAEMLRNEPA